MITIKSSITPTPVKIISSTTDIDFAISPIANPIATNNIKHKILFIFFI